MRLVSPFVLGLLFLGHNNLGWSQASISPVSIDCDSALNRTEETICETSYLAKFDIQLSELYEDVLKLTEHVGEQNALNMRRRKMKTELSRCGEKFEKKTDLDKWEKRFQIRDCIELIYLRNIIDIGEVVPKKNQKTVSEPIEKTDVKTSVESRQNIAKKIMREGYFAIEGNNSRTDNQEPQQASHKALETAYACTKRLNSALNTKRKICLNDNQDISPIGIEFSNGDKLCASIVIQGSGLPKTIVTTDSQTGSVKYENDIVAITYPARSSDREFFYNFKRDIGYSILGGVMRTEFTQCGDAE